MDRPLQKTIDIFENYVTSTYKAQLFQKIIRKTLHSQRASSRFQLPRSMHGMPGTMTPVLATKSGLHFLTRALPRSPSIKDEGAPCTF